MHRMRCENCGNELAVLIFEPPLEIELVEGCEATFPDNHEVACLLPVHSTEKQHFGVIEREFHW